MSPGGHLLGAARATRKRAGDPCRHLETVSMISRSFFASFLLLNARAAFRLSCESAIMLARTKTDAATLYVAKKTAIEPTYCDHRATIRKPNVGNRAELSGEHGRAKV